MVGLQSPASPLLLLPLLLLAWLLLLPLLLLPPLLLLGEVDVVVVFDVVLLPPFELSLEHAQIANGAIAAPTANKCRFVNMRKPP